MARRPRHLEAEHGRALVNWWGLVCRTYSLQPEDLVHVPNGGKRNAREAGLMKAEGTRAGYPDYVFDVPAGIYHGLRIELKQPNGRKPTESQLDHLSRLERRGYCCVVAFGWTEARAAIKNYLKQREISHE